MRYIFLVTLFSAILFSCKSESTNQGSNSKDSTETQVAMNSNKPVLAATDINYPSLTNDIIKNLAENCDYIDYIFYDLPISISQDNKQAIISNLNFLSRNVPSSIPNACKPMGRKFFHIDGEIILEADVYLNKEEGCFLYVFYENGKKTYANKISSDGVNFYSNVFGQAGIKQ